MASFKGIRTIKTRICMISDTHNVGPYPPHEESYAYRSPLPKAEVLLHGGDLTRVGYIGEHEGMVSMLKAADAELKLVIAGNHDLTLDEKHFMSFGYRRHRRPEWLGDKDALLEDGEKSYTNTPRAGDQPPAADKIQAYLRRVKDLYTNKSARRAGIRYLEEGVHRFTLSTGASLTVYASPYQPEFCRWAFAYPRSQDRFNPAPPGSSDPAPANPVPDYPNIDIMLTHGPPANILDLVGPDEVQQQHVGCEHLLRAAERARPRLFMFGHIHEGWGAIRGTWDASANGGIKQEEVPTDKEDMLKRRAAYYDISSRGPRPLQVGTETLFVNASIMTVRYRPHNAPWLVDLDLPCADVPVKASV